MIVAMLALFVALTGTAVAATSGLIITGKQIRNSSITGLDVKNKSLTPKDFKGSVRGPAGPQGPAGRQGPQGPQGVPGAAGTARGYARVAADGTLDPATSKGVISAAIAGGSLICFELGYTPDSVTATIESYSTDQPGPGPYGIVGAGRGQGATACPATTDAYIATADAAGAFTRYPVFVVFNGGPAAVASAARAEAVPSPGPSNTR